MSEKKINPDCPCTGDCVRHGDCEACRENHKSGLTACQKAKQKNENN